MALQSIMATKRILLLLVATFLFCNEGQAIFKPTHFLLITGTSRSGTKYIAKVLQKCGLDIGHERLGKDGISSWVMTMRTDHVPWGPARKGLQFVHIFHQVRHPLKVIASVYSTEPPESWEYILKHIPQIRKEDSLTVKCAKYWYYWNLKAYKEAEWTYRIEDLENIWDEFQERLVCRWDKKVLDQVPKDTNTRGIVLRKFTWQDLQHDLDPTLYKNIRQLALQYGYTE